MSERARTVGRVLVFVALALGLIAVAYKPFLFAPLAAVVILIAARLSDDARLTSVTATTISVCFVVGAAIAVLTRHALY